MGKTAAGAVWLSAEKTGPFDFYQYWINTDDRDVARFLKLYTFLPINEIEAMSVLEGQDLNVCKSILAFEVTKLVHGGETALSALEAAVSVFGQRRLPPDLLPSSDIPRVSGEKADAVPTSILRIKRLEDGIPAFELFAEIDLCDSRSSARRLIRQGGAYVNDDRINDVDLRIGTVHLKDGGILLKAGKKKVHRIKVD
jgi:tyrosyl-tRNA synthetase